MNRLLVLAWHNIRGTWFFPSRSGAGYSGLKRQLRLLQGVCNVVPLEQALDGLTSGASLPPRSVAITFDDGYRDNLELAAPLLRDLGLPATFFLVPGLLSREVEPWWEVVSWSIMRSEAESLEWEGRRVTLDGHVARDEIVQHVAESLKRRDTRAREAALAELVESLRPRGPRPEHELFLDWKGASELARAGFTIGSHTYSHPILREETHEAQRRELADSRRALEQGLGVQVSMLAYPNGTRLDYAPATLDAAVEAGYRYALTTEEGRNESSSHPFELRRYVMYPERGLLDLTALMPVPRRARRLARKVRSAAHRRSPVAS